MFVLFAKFNFGKKNEFVKKMTEVSNHIIMWKSHGWPTSFKQ